MDRRLSLTVVALTVMVAGAASAQNGAVGTTVATVNGSGANAWSGNVRASDAELVSLLSDGIKKSPTLRGLTDRLTKSDVIVYVRPDVIQRNGSQGHLSFLSSAGGYRYLVVHLPSGATRPQQMAMLGHELQHAVAIADAPSVIDSDTLKKVFERIGKVAVAPNGRDFSFDSPAATDAKLRVLRELSGESGPSETRVAGR